MENLDLNLITLGTFKRYIEKCVECTNKASGIDNCAMNESYYKLTREKGIPDEIAAIVWTTPVDSFQHVFEKLFKKMDTSLLRKQDKEAVESSDAPTADTPLTPVQFLAESMVFILTNCQWDKDMETSQKMVDELRDKKLKIFIGLKRLCAFGEEG